MFVSSLISQRVVQLEQKFGGALLHRPKLMEFQDDDQNLRLSLDKVMQGWQCKPSANFQVSQNVELLV